MRLDWDHLDVQLVRCGYSLWERGILYSPTWMQHSGIQNNDLLIFDTGRGEMEMQGGKIPLHKSSILWLRPGHIYHVEQDPDWPIGHVFIRFELIRADGSKYYPSIQEMPETFECFNHEHWHAMARNIVRIMVMETGGIPGEKKNDIRKTASAMLKSMLMGIDLCDQLTHPDAASVQTNMIAIQAAEFLADGKHNFIPIQRAARKFSLSRNRFTRIFSDFWHVTPQDYLIEQRIRQAKHLLAYSDSTLDEIAGLLGYSDRFFFARQFKQKTGISPGCYRLQNRSSADNNSESQLTPQKNIREKGNC